MLANVWIWIVVVWFYFSAMQNVHSGSYTMDYAVYTNYDYRHIEKKKKKKKNTSLLDYACTMAFSAPRRICLVIFWTFFYCNHILHVAPARDTRRDITDLKNKQKANKTARTTTKLYVRLKIPLFVSGRRHFAPGLFPGPLFVMNASDPSICLRLWLVNSHRYFGWPAFSLLSAPCARRLLVWQNGWGVWDLGQNLWLKMLCKSMLLLA